MLFKKDKIMRKYLIVLSVLIALTISGCATDTKQKKGRVVGAALGTLVGAGVGYAIGGGKGAAIGAGAGLLVGGLTGDQIGKYMDKQEAEMRQALAEVESASIQREQDILAITFKSDFSFGFDSAIIKPGAEDEIARVAAVLIKYPQTNISIEGYTDSKGAEEYNMDLSRRRAEAVKNSLIGRGLTSSRLQTIGFGESKPLATNDTEAGRQQNRRVRIVIVPITA
jgi:outer membrane protein OmpA-like peptidoglycan-associated protein